MRQMMSINTRRELLFRIRREYLLADESRKSNLLNSLIDATGYNRKYAITLLNQRVIKRSMKRRARTPKYGSDVIDAVVPIWRAANGICAKRLKPFLPTLIETLERFDHISLSPSIRAKILEMSESTLERLLKKQRTKEGKGLSLTRPGSLLRKQIAIKTFAQWNTQEAGFFEIDLVAHCGGDISGRFIQTLTMTDVATGWTEIFPLLYRSEENVRAGMEAIIEKLPFQVKGIDCDNGSEFLNHNMVDWCKRRAITFTRSRAHRSNDQCHVEEKNGSVVRRLAGYDRYEGAEALEVMREFYSVARLLTSLSNSKYIRSNLNPTIDIERISSRDRAKKIPKEINITPDFVAKVAPLRNGQIIYRDTSLKGFGLRVTATKKTFIVESSVNGNRIRLTIGRADFLTVDQARRNASRMIQKMSRGIDPRATNEIRTTSRQHSRVRGNQHFSDSATEVQNVERKTGAAPSSRKIELTDEFVTNAVLPSRGYLIYRDAALGGFGIRLTSRSKTFIIESCVKGKRMRLSIGSADCVSVHEARSNAADLLRQLSLGIEPLMIQDSDGTSATLCLKPRRKSRRFERIELSDNFVANVVRPSVGQKIYRDSVQDGFGIRITRFSKSFIIETIENGKRKRITFGGGKNYSVHQAREEAVRLLYEICLGSELRQVQITK